MKFVKLIYGLGTFIPGLIKLYPKKTGGTISAKYCYSVWMRHLMMANNNKLNTSPKVVAELGPGDSLGIGLAALISGAEKYYAFDVVKYGSIEKNLKVFDELVTLFKNKTPIPNEKEFPNVKPFLEDYSFPHKILNDGRMKLSLEQSRLNLIRSSIKNMEKKESIIKYWAPWNKFDTIKEQSVDMIFSQAVLEHIDDLRDAYRCMALWLKPTGFISHQIDYKSHGTAKYWNGHWAISDITWKLIRGKKPYLLNREPHSKHMKLIKQAGFNIISEKKNITKSHLQRHQLAQRFKLSLNKEDIVTSGAFIQANKTQVSLNFRGET